MWTDQANYFSCTAGAYCGHFPWPDWVPEAPFDLASKLVFSRRIERACDRWSPNHPAVHSFARERNNCLSQRILYLPDATVNMAHEGLTCYNGRTSSWRLGQSANSERRCGKLRRNQRNVLKVDITAGLCYSKDREANVPLPVTLWRRQGSSTKALRPTSVSQ